VSSPFPETPAAWSRAKCETRRTGARTLHKDDARHDGALEELSSAPRKEGPEEGGGELKMARMSRFRKLPIFVRRFDKEIMSMAIPSYTAVMLDPLATIIDVSFIGRLPESTLSLGGMGISNTILNYFGFTFFFIVVTTTTTLAQTLAQAAVVTAAARREGSQLSAAGVSEDGEGTAMPADAGVTMAGSLWGTPRPSGVLGQQASLPGVRDKDSRRQEADGEEAAGDEAGVDVHDVSEEGKAAGSRVIAGAMIVATAMGVVSAALSWCFAPQLVAFIAGKV